MKAKNKWQVVRVSEIAEVNSGVGFPISFQGSIDKEIPFYKVGDISKTVKKGEVFLSLADNYVDKDDLKKLKGKSFPEGTIVFAKIGEALKLNRRAILSVPALIDNNVMGITPREPVLSKFLYYYFLTQDLAQFSAGNTVPSIRKSSVQDIPVPLPPLAEQKRIVAILDEAFKHMETLKAKLERIPELLKKFRQTVLTHAVTGKLTEEWRKGKELEDRYTEVSSLEMRDVSFSLPIGWQWEPFDAVAKVDSKLVQPLNYLDFPLIAPDNIEAESGKLLNKPLVSDILPKSAKHFFAKGAIVYSKIRPYLSKIILADFDGLCSADMYPISTSLHTRYLYYYMLSDIFLHYATTAGERSVLPKINQKELGVIPVSTPPKIEQKEIVEKIESLFSLLGKVELQNEGLRKKLDEIPPALLAKAFRGELVDQDESDEPAYKLLKRVNEDKEAKIIRKKVSHQKTVTYYKMKGSEEESLLGFLKVEFEKGCFTFDELRSKSKLDYDELKDEIFKLLSEAKELVTIFDEKDEVIKYKLVQDEDLKN